MRPWPFGGTLKMTLYNGFLVLKPMLSAGLCKAVRQNARATPLGDRMGLPSSVLSPFFPQYTSYIVSHPKLHTPSQLFGTQEITTARGILGPNSPLSLSLSLTLYLHFIAHFPSNFPHCPPFSILPLSRLNLGIWSGDNGSLSVNV